MNTPTLRPTPAAGDGVSKSDLRDNIVELIQGQTTAAVSSLIEQAVFRRPQTSAPDLLQTTHEQMTTTISQALHYAHRLGRAPRHVSVQAEIGALLSEFNTHKLAAQWTPTSSSKGKMNQQQKRWVEEKMEQAIKEVIRQQYQDRPTQRRAAINTATPSHTQARDKLQEMQRLIDQLITPALRDQSTALDDLRAGLQTARLHWEINSHTMATLDKVQDSLREDLLRKSLVVVVLCRKMMRAVGELRG
jgi:hypothetical protein